MKVSKVLSTRVVVCLLAAAFLATFSTPKCMADLHDPAAPGDLTGSLSAGAGEIVASGNWAGNSTSLSWEVTLVDDSYWNYRYIFSAPTPSLSHFILQVSDNFTDNDIWGSNLTVLLGEYGPAPSNPGIPGTLRNAVKFEGYDEGTTTEWSFNTLRDPVYQNFYAKGGNDTYAFNSGFADGNAFIVGPDTTIVPIPSAAILGILGLSVVGIKLRKKA
ncbi:MAG: hypothetical protein ACYSWO_05785 [Planctomycetota bacterium]|jgi:hypothetical protein